MDLYHEIIKKKRKIAQNPLETLGQQLAPDQVRSGGVDPTAAASSWDCKRQAGSQPDRGCSANTAPGAKGVQGPSQCTPSATWPDPPLGGPPIRRRHAPRRSAHPPRTRPLGAPPLSTAQKAAAVPSAGLPAPWLHPRRCATARYALAATTRGSPAPHRPGVWRCKVEPEGDPRSGGGHAWAGPCPRTWPCP